MNPATIIAIVSLAIAGGTLLVMILGHRHTASTDYVEELERHIERLERELETAKDDIKALENKNTDLLKENLELLRQLAHRNVTS